MGLPKQLSNPTEYTVGIITVLANELTAVEVMLDEEHGSPLNFTQHERDDNCYSWGRMGAHNVVIASLPEGRYGLISAATALDGFTKMRYPFAQYAADYWMRHAFHNNTSRVETQVKRFIDCEIFHKLYEPSAKNSSALCRMAQEGLTWAIELLLEKDATLLNAREDKSLLAAAIQHHHDNTLPSS